MHARTPDHAIAGVDERLGLARLNVQKLQGSAIAPEGASAKVFVRPDAIGMTHDEQDRMSGQQRIGQ